MKLVTINQIVEAILQRGLSEAYAEPDKEKSEAIKKGSVEVANEAAIYLMTALICDLDGIDKAMEYFCGTHKDDEYTKFIKEVVLPSES